MSDRRTTTPPTEGALRRVIAPSAPLRRRPESVAPLDTEALHGEAVTLHETVGDWSLVQLQTDGYVGWLPADALGPSLPEPTHKLSALRSFVYPAADMKTPPTAALSFGASVSVVGTAETRGLEYGHLAGDGYVVLKHLAPVGEPAPDFIATARMFLGVPYLWGGRTSLGLDCSALVQLSLAAAGIAAPRDTDLQEAALGEAVETPSRGDLVFWKGHVGLVAEPARLLHASGFHMMVVEEPLAEAITRIAEGGSKVTSIRRLN
jgi:cell wall-associated NlpC family hydrolase